MITWQSGQKEREKRLNRVGNRWEMGNKGKRYKEKEQRHQSQTI